MGAFTLVFIDLWIEPDLTPSGDEKFETNFNVESCTECKIYLRLIHNTLNLIKFSTKLNFVLSYHFYEMNMENTTQFILHNRHELVETINVNSSPNNVHFSISDAKLNKSVTLNNKRILSQKIY